MSRIVLVNQSSTPDDAGSGNAQLFIEGNELYQQVGTSSSVKVADQDMITTNSTFTSPLSTPSVSAVNTCKAWFNWSHSGGDFHRSFNMSSSTDNGTGQYTFTFARPMANANYCVAIGSSRNGTSGNAANSLDFHSTTTTNFQIRSGNDGGSMANHENVCAAIFDTA